MQIEKCATKFLNSFNLLSNFYLTFLFTLQIYAFFSGRVEGQEINQTDHQNTRKRFYFNVYLQPLIFREKTQKPGDLKPSTDSMLFNGDIYHTSFSLSFFTIYFQVTLVYKLTGSLKNFNTSIMYE